MRLGLLSSTAHSKKAVMICCLCGRRFERGDVYVRITQHRLVGMSPSGQDVADRIQLEDGSMQKAACPTCPAKAGAPLALTGADRGWDV